MLALTASGRRSSRKWSRPEEQLEKAQLNRRGRDARRVQIVLASVEVVLLAQKAQTFKDEGRNLESAWHVRTESRIRICVGGFTLRKYQHSSQCSF